jgi:hypothetical protein
MPIKRIDYESEDHQRLAEVYTELPNWISDEPLAWGVKLYTRSRLLPLWMEYKELGPYIDKTTATAQAEAWTARPSERTVV